MKDHVSKFVRAALATLVSLPALAQGQGPGNPGIFPPPPAPGVRPVEISQGVSVVPDRVREGDPLVLDLKGLMWSYQVLSHIDATQLPHIMIYPPGPITIHVNAFARNAQPPSPTPFPGPGPMPGPGPYPLPGPTPMPPIVVGIEKAWSGQKTITGLAAGTYILKFNEAFGYMKWQKTVTVEVAPAPPGPPGPVRIVPFTTLIKSSMAGPSAKQAAIRSQAELAAFFAPREVPPLPANALPVNYATEMLMGVAMGAQSSGGHAIEITSIEQTMATGTTLVRYRETRPGPNDIVTMVITAPVHVVRLEKLTGTVRFERETTTPPPPAHVTRTVRGRIVILGAPMPGGPETIQIIPVDQAYSALAVVNQPFKRILGAEAGKFVMVRGRVTGSNITVDYVSGRATRDLPVYSHPLAMQPAFMTVRNGWRVRIVGIYFTGSQKWFRIRFQSGRTGYLDASGILVGHVPTPVPPMPGPTPPMPTPLGGGATPGIVGGISGP
jgi:hypothetical protein